MTKKQKEQVLQGLCKKENMAYWDAIDETVEEFIQKLIKLSYAQPNCYEDEDWEELEEDERELSDEYWEFVSDLRDFAVKRMERKFKAWFPYVNEEY